jgi:hypothetical protein
MEIMSICITSSSNHQHSDVVAGEAVAEDAEITKVNNFISVVSGQG